MIYRKEIGLLLFLSYFSLNATTFYQWAVIGAGPAGITAVAALLEKVPDTDIVWIDPEFNVGRMGKYYRNIPSNLQIWRLLTYIYGLNLLKEFKSPHLDTLYQLDSKLFLPLSFIVDPLIDFTRFLCTRVTAITTTIESITRSDHYWLLKASNNGTITANKVILAIGAHPKQLGYDLPTIALDEAIDKEKLSAVVDPHDTIGVFGGMHSALLVLKHLTEISVKKIINFYSTPFYLGKPGEPGLEGATAEWATALENNPPAQLLRVKNTPENREKFLPECTKVIYGIGYEPNTLMVNGTTKLSFNKKTGKIDHHLYGAGIAFPITYHAPSGRMVELNGFNTYLQYIKTRLPGWLKE